MIEFVKPKVFCNLKVLKCVCVTLRKTYKYYSDPEQVNIAPSF